MAASTMKAYAITQGGGPEQIKVSLRPKPTVVSFIAIFLLDNNNYCHS